MEEVRAHMTKRFNGLVAMGAAGLLAVAGAAPAGAQDTVSIDMIAAEYDDMAPYFNDLAARFMEQNPDIEVSVQVVSWNDIYDVINTRVAAGDPPDIMNLNYFANFAAEGLLHPAEDIVSEEALNGIIQAFRDNSKYDGIEYAVPDLASNRAFFYNTLLALVRVAQARQRQQLPCHRGGLFQSFIITKYFGTIKQLITS